MLLAMHSAVGNVFFIRAIQGSLTEWLRASDLGFIKDISG